MNIIEMLDALDASLVEAREKRLKGGDRCLDLIAPNGHLLGATGKRVGIDEESRRSIYTFTVDQVQAMSDSLRAAIREDAGLPPPDRRRP